MKAWEQAIALCKPSDGVKLTRAEEQQKRSCEEGLKAAKDAMQRRDRRVASNVVSIHEEMQTLPWQRAEKMVADSHVEDNSSVSQTKLRPRSHVFNKLDIH